MNQTLEKIREALSRLDSKQRVQLGLALVATLGLVWGFTSYVNRVRYGVLFSRLDQRDASLVMAELKDRNVNYRMSGAGSLIEVPFDQVDALRLELAADGLPSGGGAGFELFDKPAFGLSDFVQNVNYQRALERELARTIQSLDVVDTARVHLALPPESVFAGEHAQPSASVVVRLRSGRALAADRVRAISHLVASGVEGIDPRNVSVIDADGRMMSVEDEGDSALSATQVERKRSTERGIESRLKSILEPIVGMGKVAVRATVEFNMTRVQRVEESFDPAGAVVRSEQRSKSKSQGGSGPGGVPGTASNLPGGTQATANASSDKQETQSSTTNFEINKTVSTISEPVGLLARQSVAVVIDHAAPEAGAEGEADGGSATPVPRSQEQMDKITEIVRATVGFNANRGDVLTVENIPFDSSVLVVDAGTGVSIWDTVMKILRLASLPLAVLLLALLVIRPAISMLKSLGPASNAIDGPPTIAELQARVQAQLAGGSITPEMGEATTPLRRKLTEAVVEDPKAASLVIRDWLEQRGTKEKAAS